MVFFPFFRCVESLNCAAASVEDFETDIFGFAFDEEPSFQGMYLRTFGIEFLFRQIANVKIIYDAIYS